MRAKNKEVTDLEEIDRIIRSCDCCRLGLADGNRPYIVPLNFGYAREDGKPVFYFHGAREGRKMDLIRRNGCAGFELDTNHLLHESGRACGYSYRYQSVIGTGAAEEITDREEKRRALQYIMEHYSGKSDWNFDDKALDATAVIRLAADELACKAHK